jgi:putative ABC transport system substrate-binding protein
MTTRRHVLLAGALSAMAPGVALAQQARRTPRIGVLHAGSAKEPPAIQREPFERGLREHGWIPGSTVIIEYRYAEGDADRLPQLAADLVRTDVDVIVARANAAIQAARRATTKIPIVMSAYAGDPAAEGIVKNHSRPGGNLTGLVGHLELDGKRLELLKEAFPRISRVAVVSNPSLDGGRSKERMAQLYDYARALKLQLQVFEIKRATEIAETFAAIHKANVDALLVRGDPEVLDPYRAEIAAQAARLRLPAVYWWRFFVDAGGLMSYGDSIPAFHYRSATYVGRILKGANPAELAIEQPTKFDLIVNLRTAKSLGVEIPKAVLFRADELVQ